MGDEKISSDEVPAKFAEWLLSMGCPVEKVPSLDKVTEMCRGQYYMVWRSLMEHVEPKDVIRRKRLQVFCDDIRKCQKKNVFSERDSTAILPEEVVIWRQQAELKEKVDEAKARMILVQKDLHQLMDKISSKMFQRNISSRRAEDLQRRAWLLHQVAESLRTKKANLQETKSIADSLCSIDEDDDIQSKLDRCVTSLRRQNSQLSANPAASSTVVSVNGDGEFEEQLWSLVRCRGDALCSQLYERRAELVRALTAGIVDAKKTHESSKNSGSPQSALAHTAALQCTLALEAAKSRLHLKQARGRLVNALADLNNYVTGDSCELLVLRCERAHSAARVAALRQLLDEAAVGGGAFSAGDQPTPTPASVPLAALDRAIESKRDELKRIIASLAATERKIQNVRECLVTVFNGFHRDAHAEIDRFRSGHSELTPESLATLRQFYEGRRERRRQKADLSLDLEVSDCSFDVTAENNNPTFIDELRTYMKKFNLEKNRKLVLDNGEKVWIFESLESSVARLHSRWLSDELSCQLVAPAVSVAGSVCRLVDTVQQKTALEDMLTGLGGGFSVKDIDIKSQTQEEEQIMDKIKKRLKENLLTLQKTQKTLELGQENLRLWSENKLRKYIGLNRTVNGMHYKCYENYYLDSCLGVL